MDAIAERRLELRTASGVLEVVVALKVPTCVGPDEWACEYEVRFGSDVRTWRAHGGDSMQALQLSMVTLDVELEVEAKRREGVLFHLDEPFVSILENGGMQSRRTTQYARRDAT